MTEPRKTTPLQQRMQDEAQGADPEAMERFMAEHDGMTPYEYALHLFPSARAAVERGFRRRK